MLLQNQRTKAAKHCDSDNEHAMQKFSILSITMVYWSIWELGNDKILKCTKVYEQEQM